MVTSVRTRKRNTYQTHLIGEDAVLINVPVMTQPVYPVHLEWHEFELGILPEVRLRVASERLLPEPPSTLLLRRSLLVPLGHCDRLCKYESRERLFVSGVFDFPTARWRIPRGCDQSPSIWLIPWSKAHTIIVTKIVPFEQCPCHPSSICLVQLSPDE